MALHSKNETLSRRRFLQELGGDLLAIASIFVFPPIPSQEDKNTHIPYQEGLPQNETEPHYGWQNFGRVIPEALQTFLLPDESSEQCPQFDIFDKTSAVYPKRSLIRYDFVPGKPEWGIILGERSRYNALTQSWTHIQPDNTSFVIGSYFKIQDLEPWLENSELTVLENTVPGNKYIEVDLKTFHLRLYEVDLAGTATLVMQTLIAGNPELTPAGTFPITAKQFVDTMIGTSRASEQGYNHYSVSFSMQFTSYGEKLHDSAFMEADQYPDSWLRGNIRRVVRSNGCVRIPVYSAQEFIDWQTYQDSLDGEIGENPEEQEDYFWAAPEYWEKFKDIPIIEFIFRWTRPHINPDIHLEGMSLSYEDPIDTQILQDPSQVTMVKIIK